MGGRRRGGKFAEAAEAEDKRVNIWRKHQRFEHQENYLEDFSSTSPSSFNNVNSTTNQKQVSRERGWLDTLAFMSYHESVKHIILMYDSGKRNQQLHIIKSVKCATHNFLLCRPPKSTFRISLLLSVRGWERKEKNIFHRRQKENKRIFPLLTKHCLEKLLRLHHLFVTHKKATSKWNFLFSFRRAGNLLWFNDVVQECLRNRNIFVIAPLSPRSSHLPTLWHIKIGMFSLAWKSIQQHIFPLVSCAYWILNK